MAKHRVEFVLVGALAARLHGFPQLTADAHLTPGPNPENLRRLGAALQELDARVYTESVPEGLAFDCSAATLARANIWNLVTAAGRVDVIFQALFAASLEDILRSKEAADRPQDRQDAVVIREMLRVDRMDRP